MDKEDVLTNLSSQVQFCILDILDVLPHGIALGLWDKEQVAAIRLRVKEEKDHYVGIISFKNGSSCPSGFDCCLHNKQVTITICMSRLTAVLAQTTA